MLSYQYAKDDELTREDLINDEDFILDAGDYLAKRGVLDSEDPNEIYDKFMEQMRYHEVNELDTISDLMYAQEAEGEDREQMARMFETFDRMDLDFTDELIGKVSDYGWGVATAPSTILGFVTGGSGKVASFAGQRAAQAGLRRILAGMATGAAVEAGIGAGQNVAQQATRMELDPDREFSGTELALTAGLSAIPGAVTGGLGQARRNRLAIKADKLKEQADAAMANAEDLANKQVKKVIDADSSGVQKLVDELAEDGFEEGAVVERGKLSPIDPELLEEGETLFTAQARLIDEGYAVRLNRDIVNRIAVVGKELAEKGGLKVKEGQRVSEAVAKAILNKEIPAEILDEVLDTYNISHRDLGPLLAKTASEAGKDLQAFGQISKSWSGYTDELKRQKFDSPGAQPADPDTPIVNFIKSPFRIANKIERLRRSVLTSQPVTTIRNFFGGGARVTLDMFEQFWASGTRKAANAARTAMGKEPIEDISTIGAGDIARYVWNGEEAKMVADMYMRIDKKGYERMFSNFIDAAGASNNAAVGNGFDRVGSFFNVFNRMSDNFWKKATFAGELSRLTRARYGKTLTDIISEGQFGKIDEDIFEKAVDKSFELVYQQTPKGGGIFSDMARGYLNADKKAGFILGALIPFPRFVINQIKFMYEHAPVLGMIPVDALTAKGGLKDFNWSKRVGQQINGLGLLGMAYALRDAMGSETEWYRYVKEDGTKLDLRPFLGPLNMHLYIADAIYRSGLLDGKPKPIKAAGGMTGEIIQTAVGSSFRAGTGLFVVDRALPELLGSFDGEEPTIKTDQVIGQILGDYANTYTYQWPIAVARDLYSLTDEDLRQVPETKIGLDYLEITALRARRSLGPLADWLPTVSEEFLKKDIPYIPDVTLKHMFPFYNVDKPQERYDIFDPKPLRKIDPIRTAVSGLNISPAANTFVKERIRLQLEPYEIYRAHPFPPADRYIRQELSQRLPMQMEKVIKSEKYQNATDAEKKVAFVREAKFLMNEIRNKSRIDEAIAKELRLGRIPDATERDHLKWKFESLPKMYRDAVKARLGAPTEDSDYADYLKEYDVIKESWFGKVKKAQGGLVQKFAVGGTPTPVDEQMDALSLSETGIGEEPEEGQSLSGILSKVKEVGGEVWDNMNYLDRAALVTAPVPVVGDVTGLLADAYMYATKPEERTALNYSLTGAGILGGLPASVTSAIGSSPALLGIFGAANPELRKRYEDILNAPLTKEQENVIAENPSAIADIMEEKAKEAYQETGVFKQSDIGMDQIPRIEFDDSKAELLDAGVIDKLQNVSSSQLTVGDILKYDDLFEAYPEARNIQIVPHKTKGDESYGGSFAQPTKSNPRGGISINPRMNPDQVRSVILHELQHYVQFADYLHRGANKNEFLPAGINQVEDVLQAKTNKFSNTLMTTATPEGLSLAGELKLKLKLSPSKQSEIIHDVMRRISPTGTTIEKSKVARDTVAELEKLLGKETTDELIAHANKVKQLDTVKERAFNNYLSASGEVEARFTQSRRNMTFEERMQEIPDVSLFFDSEYPAVFNRHKTTLGATRTDKDYIEDITDNYLAELNKQNESMIKLAEELGLDDVARGIKETMRIQNETKQIVPGANRSMSEGANIYDDFGTTPDTFEDAKKAWLKRTGKKPNTDVSERITEMEEAAQKVKAGELDVEEFRKIADQYKPVKVWEDVPEMATFEDMFFALDARKRNSPFVGYNSDIPEGTRMTSRLDIPAYTSSDTWVVTLLGKQEGDKSMYAPAVRLKNVDLNQPVKNQQKALKVASGAGKGPFAVMEGDYVESTAEDAYNLAKEAINSDEWIQVGYDPTRRGYFYDRKTMEPVLNAEEIVQVGALVLAKKAVKGDPKDFTFKKGGLMSRK